MNEVQRLEDARDHPYHIVVAGELDPTWSVWLGNMEITSSQSREGEPLTILSGTLPDQAALRGVLNKIWDLRLTLISVTRDHDSLDKII